MNDRWQEIAHELGSYEFDPACGGGPYMPCGSMDLQPKTFKSSYDGTDMMHPAGDWVQAEPACQRIADLEAKLADLARHTAIVEADLLRLLPSEPAGGAS